jgi:tRNA-specific 2-thiouridylase
LINARKKDSQDICFVPDGDYGRFIEEYTGIPAVPGAIVDENGNQIGTHRGFYRYTRGQRRGLGVSKGGGRLYVTATSAKDNQVTLGTEASLYGGALLAAELNLIACERLERPLRAKVKTRYLQQEADAYITQTGEGTVRVDFDKPQRAVTPGQAAVFYDGDIVIGGAVITDVIR